MFSFSWGIYWFWIASLVYFIKNSIVKLRIIFSIIMDKILAFSFSRFSLETQLLNTF